MLLVASLVLLPSFMVASDPSTLDSSGACTVETHNCEKYDSWWDSVIVPLREFLEKPDLCFSCDLGKGAQELAENPEAVGYEQNPKVEFSLSYYYPRGRGVDPARVIEGLNLSTNEPAVSKVKGKVEVTVVGCGKNDTQNDRVDIVCIFPTL